MAVDSDILSANLSRLGAMDQQLVQRVRSVTPIALQWTTSRAGVPCASVDHGGSRLWLCSRYDPMSEADKLAGRVDPSKDACVITLGLGLGYHVARIASRISDTKNLLVVFEPDLAMLRAVLENIDHSAWLGQSNVILVDDTMDRAALLARIEPFSGMLTQGTLLVTHPPTRQLHEESFRRFSQTITEVLEFCRTNMATALVNAARTYRNLSVNLHRYAAGSTVDQLHGAASGFAAVCIGAGPSLTRNIGLLEDPKTRSNVVVIAAQTMLKPLLARGIRPHFVTALDYHEISTRFYEGLGRLEDVTLVAQPLVHPAVLDCYPGPIRLTQSGFLDQLLGDQARPIVPMPYGATVSHLSFYLAQHLGCDPIILVGMDLGFSDGLYYFPGTAIHDVWAPELGPFVTLEMMEWQRIVRHRSHLKKMQDIHGQPMYADEQMLTYLKQFERDFGQAPQQVIDATEGGLPKNHTMRQTLAQALRQYAQKPLEPLPAATEGLDRGRLRDAAKAIRQRRREVWQLRDLSRRTIPLLRQMVEHQRDPSRMDQLFGKLAPIQRRVEELSVAFDLVNQLNTVGVFKRSRADRQIDHAQVDPVERQHRQLQRDIENVQWLIQVCDEMLNMLNESIERCQGSHRRPQPAREQPVRVSAAMRASA